MGLVSEPMGEHIAAFDEVPLERPNWFEGRLLTSGDLDRQQSYVRERMRRRNRLLHGWGVVTGLDVEARDGVSLSIAPGFALDAAGNEIIVPSEIVLDAKQAGLQQAGKMHWLAIRWDECPTGSTPAPWPGEPDLAAAWQEDCELKVLDEQPDDGPVTTSRAATPWLALATVVWNGRDTLTLDASVRRPLQLPVEP